MSMGTYLASYTSFLENCMQATKSLWARLAAILVCIAPIRLPCKWLLSGQVVAK